MRRLPLILAALALMGAGPCDSSPECDLDSDGDGVCEFNDVCPGADDGVDSDGDGLPDACDPCPGDDGGDADGDGNCDALDPCPLDSPDDADGNGVCDVEDAYPRDGELGVDQVQLRGTHNSYHQQPPLPLHPSHRYTQPPLGEQLALWGTRAFEIDLHLHDSGYRVYHLLGIDEASSCNALVECLAEIRDFSDANRHHAPIMVWFEVKDDAGGRPVDELDSLDRALRGVFGDDRILSPDDVRGDFESLREAIDTVGWPSLGEARGKILFMLLESGSVAQEYREGTPRLAGRVMFPTANGSTLGAPWAAVAKINDPRSGSIPGAHERGILVASNICAADDGDGVCDNRLAAGLDNGVHMLKDDFPAPVDGRNYFLDLPGGDIARCNPITAPPECSPADIE